LLDEYKLVESTEIDKTERPEHVKLIPHFDIVVNDKVLKSLQSSDIGKFKTFLTMFTPLEI